jgi:hypothetical protein
MTKAGGNACFLFLGDGCLSILGVVLRESGGPSTPRRSLDSAYQRRPLDYWIVRPSAQLRTGRTMTAVTYSPHSRAILASAQPSQ